MRDNVCARVRVPACLLACWCAPQFRTGQARLGQIGLAEIDGLTRLARWLAGCLAGWLVGWLDDWMYCDGLRWTAMDCAGLPMNSAMNSAVNFPVNFSAIFSSSNFPREFPREFPVNFSV